MFPVLVCVGRVLAGDGPFLLYSLTDHSFCLNWKRLIMEENLSLEAINRDKKDANTCMALGAGVGILGAASAALAGAVCPLCIFIAPGLVGYGAYKRWTAGDKRISKSN